MSSKRQTLVELIAERTLKTSDHNELVKEIADVLLAENSVNDLNSIIRDVIEQRITKGIVEAQITSAFPLKDDTKNEIKRLIKKPYPQAKEIILNEKIDTDYLGGVRITLPTQEVDLSIRAKIEDLKNLTILESSGV